jgi:flagellar hook assembly protein FlgD
LHFVVVQVWDGCNNFTRDTLYFTVTNQQAALIRVEAYPNPFTNQVTISFEHNQAGKNTTFDVQISDMNGRLVKRWLLNEIPGGFRQVQVTWDGTGNNGPKCHSGLYICRIQMTTAEGEVKTGTAKLILID